MLVGHYSASFALASVTKDVRLWVLFIGVQLMDVIWTTLLLLGVEKVKVVPTLASVPLDLYYMPYSHSLISVLIVCVMVFLLYRSLVPPRSTALPAILVSVSVLSHWVLDVFVHRPDLPLYDDAAKIGLGLWNHPAWAYLLEIGLLWTAILLYLRGAGGSGKFAIATFGIVLTVVQAGLVFGPVPGWLTPASVAVSLLAFYFVMAGVAWRLERARPHRRRARP